MPSCFSSSHIDGGRYAALAHLLIAVLLFGAAVPCGLLEASEMSACATEIVCTEGANDDHTGGLYSDCCAACLACCPSCTEPPAPQPPAAVSTAASDVLSSGEGPPGSLLSIWHPPRA